MNQDFPRILSLLRKERGLTQKKAAADLDVAQALLSHYEKGKRECGLDFLVKAADYYNVSTDYLLGRSPVSNGGIISQNDIPETSESEKSNNKSGDLMTTLNKKLITNSIDVIFSYLGKAKCSKLSQHIASMLMMSVYKAFRITYTANNRNDNNMFSIPDEKAPYLVNCAISLEDGEASLAASEVQDAPAITTNLIETEYDKRGTALLSLVKNAESKLKQFG